MDTRYGFKAFIAIFCVVFVLVIRFSASESLGTLEQDSCEPVVQAGKELPQRATYRIDDKRSYGKPGNMSHLVQRKQCEIVFPRQPHDCADIQASGASVSGIYSIFPGGIGRPCNVYCDMETDGGGWTVIQRRIDGSVDFFRNWWDYKNGFGSVSSEHWLGNENIYRMLNEKSYELRVDLKSITGITRSANYMHFHLDNERENYKLTIRSYYHGNAGDSFSFHSGQHFSTKDRDNDGANSSSCATSLRSGWWYKSCGWCDLNGVYLTAPYRLGRAVTWKSWPTLIGETEMKIRPANKSN